jgi:hypothetical protein
MDIPRFGTTIHLPPMSFTELFSRALRLYTANLVKFVIPAALLGAVSAVLVSNASTNFLDQLNASGINLNDPTAFQRLSNEETTRLLGVLVGGVAGILNVIIWVSLIRGMIIDGLIVYFTSESHLGRSAPIGQSLQVVFRRMLVYFVAAFLAYILLAILGTGLAFIFFACGLGFGVLAYTGLNLLTLLAPTSYLERGNPLDALSRAWYLAKRRFWVMVGAITVLAVISSVINALLNALLPDQTISVLILGVIEAVLIAPFSPIIATLLYYDVRTRHEGLEVALNTAITSEPRPSDLNPQQSTGPFMEGSDFVNLGILTALLFVLLLAYTALSFTLLGGARAL